MSGGLPPYGREPDGPYGSSSGDTGGEETFAEVVHGFTFGSGRRKRRRKRGEEPTAAPVQDGASSGGWPVVTNPAFPPVDRMAPEPEHYDEPEIDPEDDAAIVRPY